MPRQRRSAPAQPFEVRNSPVHGRGVFAIADIPAGKHLLDYGGDIVDWDVAQQRWEESGVDPDHTFFFDRGDGTVIDGGSNGNEARFINHGCDPNCEALDDGGTISISTRRRVRAGDELFIDYALIVDERDAETAETYACRCGAASCRGTMLAAPVEA